MKVWKLIPLTDSGAPSLGWVRIRAGSAQRAREIAFNAFNNTKVSDVVHANKWSEVDWHDATKVQCQLEEEDVSNLEGILDIV